jgi:NADH pyrophosphatase NudC (nudix superfamily)
LLTQRSLTKSHDAGLYCFLGEHVFSGESYESCLVRGTEEELGYTPSNYIYAAENIFKYQLQTERVKFYLAVWDGKSLTWDNKELESVHWVSLTDLKSDKYNKSEMTQFWIDHVDWSSAIGVDL